MSRKHITIGDRHKIEGYLKIGLSRKGIGEKLGFCKDSIKREIRRNSCEGRNGVVRYNANDADRLCRERREKANKKFVKLESPAPENKELARLVEEKLKENWSPEQISGRFRLPRQEGGLADGGADGGLGIKIAAQTIYDWIFNFRRDLSKHLHYIRGRWRYRHKRKYYERKERHKQMRIRERGIESRPKEVDERKVVGHWEGDTVVGAKRGSKESGRIITIVERVTGYLLADKIQNIPNAVPAPAINLSLSEKFAGKVVRLLKDEIVANVSLAEGYAKTLTLDNGSEMAGFETIEKEMESKKNPKGMKVYFAAPYHSWERGTNENTNGLLRFYFPKKTHFDTIQTEDLKAAVAALNNRPRKRLGYRTPLEVFSEVVGGGHLG